MFYILICNVLEEEKTMTEKYVKTDIQTRPCPVLT